MPLDEPTFESTHRDGRRLKRGCLVTFLAWLLLMAGVYGLNKLPPQAQETWQWLYTILWLGLIFGIPTVGILQALELKAYLDWSSQGKGGRGFYRFLVILGSWLFALVAGAVGLMAIAGLFETGDTRSGWQTAGLLAFCLIICGIALLLFWLPFMRLSETNEAGQMAAAALYLQQMAHPDFAALEQLTGQILPPAYRAMFEPGSPWLQKSWTLDPLGVDQDDVVHEFVEMLPAYPSSLRKHPGWKGDFLCFAIGDETEYWLLLGTEDPPVFEVEPDEETSLTVSKPICEHLSVFLNWPKEES